MTPFEQIKALAAGLAPGTADRSDCPKCLSPDKTLSIQMTQDGPHWRCFRASCGYHGGPRGKPFLLGDKPAKAPRVLTEAMRFAQPDDTKKVWDRFGWAPTATYYVSDVDGRYCLPVWGPNRAVFRGYVKYLFDGNPKTLTYNERPHEPFMHWSRYPARGLPTVLVEDWWSAERVQDTGLATGVALMGTYISPDAALEINDAADGAVYVALDRDAFAKSVAYAVKYGWKTWALNRDLKYETAGRIAEALDGQYDFRTPAPSGNDGATKHL